MSINAEGRKKAPMAEKVPLLEDLFNEKMEPVGSKGKPYTFTLSYFSYALLAACSC